MTGLGIRFPLTSCTGNQPSDASAHPRRAAGDVCISSDSAAPHVRPSSSGAGRKFTRESGRSETRCNASWQSQRAFNTRTWPSSTSAPRRSTAACTASSKRVLASASFSEVSSALPPILRNRNRSSQPESSSGASRNRRLVRTAEAGPIRVIPRAIPWVWGLRWPGFRGSSANRWKASNAPVTARPANARRNLHDPPAPGIRAPAPGTRPGSLDGRRSTSEGKARPSLRWSPAHERPSPAGRRETPGTRSWTALLEGSALPPGATAARASRG